MICLTSSQPAGYPTGWQEGFLALLPAIRRQAESAFRGLPRDIRQEWVAEAIAHALAAYARLAQLDKTDLAYPTVLAKYAIAHVRSERRLGSGPAVRDAFSRIAQRKHGFQIQRLDQPGPPDTQWREAVLEDLRTPVPDQVAFRIDFPQWLSGHSRRNRRIALALAAGERPREVACRFRLSRGRISQLRHEFHRSWQTFQGEEPDPVPAPPYRERQR